MSGIRPAVFPEDLALVSELLKEYASTLGISLCFQGFDQELATLPGRYAPPDGRLLLGDEDGCVALRPFDRALGICEMKRLYVRPAARRTGLGRRLVERLLAEARDAGYERMRLDTLPSMARAQEIYRALGFVEIAPYTDNPVPGATFLELDLSR